MLTKLHKLLARPRKKPVAGTFRMALEALESRTVLSATHLAAQAALGDPFPGDALRAPFHADPAPGLAQVGAPHVQDKLRDASDIRGRHPIETSAPGPVNSVRFATEPCGPRPLDPGDAARLRFADPAMATWNSPSYLAMGWRRRTCRLSARSPRLQHWEATWLPCLRREHGSPVRHRSRTFELGGMP